MVTLYQLPPFLELPSMSPFCVKVETYLRMTQLEYETVPIKGFYKAPYGRVPYVKIDGALVGDSTLIVQHLKKRFGDPLDSALTREQLALSLCLQVLVEDHFFFAAGWLRWSEEESWKYVRQYFAPALPRVGRGWVLRMIRRSVLKELSEGIPELGREETIEFAKADLTAISDLLGDKPYFTGDHPASIDATVYGFLIQQLWVPWSSPVKDHGLALGNLPAFCERMKNRYWGAK